MHEMSLTLSLLAIVREEMQKHGATRLLLVRVRSGAISQVVPEALDMAFTVLTQGTACPQCGQELGHRVLAGKSLYIEHLEVE